MSCGSAAVASAAAKAEENQAHQSSAESASPGGGLKALEKAWRNEERRINS